MFMILSTVWGVCQLVVMSLVLIGSVARDLRTWIAVFARFDCLVNLPGGSNCMSCAERVGTWQSIVYMRALMAV